jgi:methionyl aminopeptidase
MEGNQADWIKAGQIAADVREFSRSLVKPGEKLLSIAESIERRIADLGAIPAFPVNLSLDDCAAHYSPIEDDPIVLEGQVIKVDIGVCYNGAIGDTAYTVDLSGKHSDMVKASIDALKSAERTLAPGVSVGEVGKAIIEAIQSYGYSPIKNLSGHGLGLYSVHQKPSIPNFDTGEGIRLEKGMTIAIEPFATDGAGMIKESSNAMIFSAIGSRPVRSPFAREVLSSISEYKGLPFASRWISAKLGPGKARLGLRELMLAGNVRDYPPLVEIRKGIVTQAEHSFLIDDKVICLTKSRTDE